MIFSWFLTMVALAGAIMNSQAKKEGFYLWLISNLGFSIYNASIGEWAMSVLFACYLVITINGIRTWNKKDL